jgi:hypothetical protein
MPYLNIDVRLFAAGRRQIMQSTQSSGTVFFRALVMAGFLGVIFYAAVSGNALPDAARKKIEKFLPQMFATHKPASSELANHSSAVHAATEAPLFNSLPTKTTSPGENTVMPPAMENPSVPRKLAVEGSPALLSASPAGGVAPLQAGNNPGSVLPVDYQAPLNAAAGAAAPFSQIQERLKQLGATYYLLETWGNEQQLFRFYCKMAVGGNENYTRCFEHISADPLLAMKEVLKQVEESRNGGLIAR